MGHWFIVNWGYPIVLFILVFLAFAYTGRYVFGRDQGGGRASGGIPIWVRLPLAVRFHYDLAEEKRQLLAAAGVRMAAERYEAVRRWGMIFAVLGGTAGWLTIRRFGFHLGPPAPGGGLLLVSVLVFAGALADSMLLQAASRHRSHQIVKEIYAVSHQLLYYSGSRLNLHTKLMRCLPHTRIIRSEFSLLLNEWYRDAEGALKTFRERLGTDEAWSFAETVNSIRQGEREELYALIRQRISDYKDKLDMIRSSRKETTSYLLFVLAGLPIMNTFRLFMYPWIQEGQKLFQTLQ